MTQVTRPPLASAADEFDRYSGSYRDAVNDAIGLERWTVDDLASAKAALIRKVAEAHFGATAGLDALDVGCGIGLLDGLLAPSFARLTGVDVSADSIDVARANNPSVGYEAFDGAALPYADASHDFVFTVCVLHHVSPGDWQHFIDELHRVLRPGGMVLVYEHNPYNPATRLIVNRCPFDRDAVLLSARRSRDLLRAAGFGAVASRYVFAVPGNARLLRRIDGAFARLPVGAQYYTTGVR